MNPLIQKYLLEKFGQDFGKNDEANYNKSLEANRAAATASAFGDALAGNKIGSQDEYFNQLNKEARESTIGKTERQKKEALAEYDIEKSMKSDVEKNDKNSEAAKMAQESLIEAGFKPELVSNKSLAELESLSPYTKMIIDKRKQDKEYQFKREENALKRAELGQRRSELQDLKIQEKQNQLQTPFGLAQTSDDAKQLKSASEEKANFDRKIQELIDLRKTYGGEIGNREAVARGKQLSKDLLLAYKNMSKLGVLSQSDEAIINAIIPPDPLEFRSPLAAMQGQDPILNNLQKFKDDAEADFQQKLRNRLRNPEQALNKIENQSYNEPDVEAYAKKHGISYSEALQIKNERTQKQAAK